MKKLKASGKVHHDDQRLYRNVAMAIPEDQGESTFRVASNNSAVNAAIEQAVMPEPNLEAFRGLGRHVRWISFTNIGRRP